MQTQWRINQIEATYVNKLLRPKYYYISNLTLLFVGISYNFVTSTTITIYMFRSWYRSRNESRHAELHRAASRSESAARVWTLAKFGTLCSFLPLSRLERRRREDVAANSKERQGPRTHPWCSSDSQREQRERDTVVSGPRSTGGRAADNGNEDSRISRPSPPL